MPEPIRAWLETNSAMALIVGVSAGVWLIRQIWLILKASWPGLRQFTRFLESLLRLPEFMTEVSAWKDSASEKLDANATALEIVRREVLPNHGSSLRDQVDRISARTERIESHEVNDLHRLDTLSEGFTLLASFHAGDEEHYRRTQMTALLERLMQIPNEPDSC